MASKFSVEFFKVPFDNTYKKVFDINSLKPGDTPKTAFYNEVLLATLQYFSVDSNIINLKRYNNRIIFTISDSYFAIRQYNYICLNYLNNKYFYFITDIVSENDNAVNPAVTITGEWDIWHNNLNTIYSDADYSNLVNMNKIIYGHKTVYKENNGYLQITPYRNTEERVFIKKDEIFDYTPTDYPYDNIDIGNKVKILWLKLTVTDEFFNAYNAKLITNQKDIVMETTPEDLTFVEYGKMTGFRPITNSNFTNIIYIPYGVFYKGENVKATIKNNPLNGTNFITAEYYDKSHNRYDTFEFKQSEYNLGKIPVLQDLYANIYRIKNDSGMTSYITSIELTYYSPYRYTYVYNDIKKQVILNFYTPIIELKEFFIGDNENHPIITFGYVDKIEVNMSETTPEGIVIKKNYDYMFSKIEEIKNIDIDYWLFEFIKNYTIDLRSSFMGRGVSRGVYTYEDSGGIIEPQINLFPYSYYTIYYNRDEYILQVPINDFSSNRNSNLKCEYRIEINNQTSQPFFRLFYNDKLLFNGNIFLKNSGLVSYSKDASADYNIRNGAQDVSSIALKTIASGISGGYVGAIMSGASGIVGLTSKYYDLSKTPDSPQSSSRSEDDIYIQDDIKIYKNTIIDTTIFNEKLKHCYIYGYDFISYDNLFENHKFWWDYRKTENCNINISLKTIDKKIIESMFNNGVHLFHINYGNNKYYVDNNMEINKEIYWNIDKDIAVYN